MKPMQLIEQNMLAFWLGRRQPQPQPHGATSSSSSAAAQMGGKEEVGLSLLDEVLAAGLTPGRRPPDEKLKVADWKTLAEHAKLPRAFRELKWWLAWMFLDQSGHGCQSAFCHTWPGLAQEVGGPATRGSAGEAAGGGGGADEAARQRDEAKRQIVLAMGQQVIDRLYGDVYQRAGTFLGRCVHYEILEQEGKNKIDCSAAEYAEYMMWQETGLNAGMLLQQIRSELVKKRDQIHFALRQILDWLATPQRATGSPIPAGSDTATRDASEIAALLFRAVSASALVEISIGGIQQEENAVLLFSALSHPCSTIIAGIDRYIYSSEF